MTDAEKRQLTQAGMNLETAMERFMNNDSLLERFLKKFQNDKSYNELKDAIAAGDKDRAFAASHTLKGVSANLSFDTLCEKVSKQTEEFRSGSFDTGVAMMDEVTEEYERIAAVLKEIFG